MFCFVPISVIRAAPTLTRCCVLQKPNSFWSCYGDANTLLVFWEQERLAEQLSPEQTLQACSKKRNTVQTSSHQVIRALFSKKQNKYFPAKTEKGFAALSVLHLLFSPLPIQLLALNLSAPPGFFRMQQLSLHYPDVFGNAAPLFPFGLEADSLPVGFT